MKVGLNDGIAAGFAVLHRPLLLRAIDLPQIGETRASASAFTSPDPLRNRDRQQDANDQDDDHDFD